MPDIMMNRRQFLLGSTALATAAILPKAPDAFHGIAWTYVDGGVADVRPDKTRTVKWESSGGMMYNERTGKLETVEV